jgi:glycosyltransferase involved in cell wall biosynthesis
MTRIAVLIPVWNRAATLGRAIESARCQDPDELVVVDDASTDGSVELAESLGVQVIRHPQHSDNWIKSLGVAIKSLKSDYVIAMGADDVLYEPLLQNVREVVQPQSSRGWPGVVFGDYALLREANPPEVLEVRKFGMHGVTAMSRSEAQEWFRASSATRNECGVGAAIRRDLLLWLHEEEWWRLGPKHDSFGYVVAAARGGCVYVPQVHSGFTVIQQHPSYHQQILGNAEHRQQLQIACDEWLKRPAIAEYAQGIAFQL